MPDVMLKRYLQQRAQDDPDGLLRDLTDFAGEMGFDVTSANQGAHNPGSAHYQNRAIDVRTRNQTPEAVDAMIREGRARGYRVIDERRRPQGRRWTGPHLHLENPGNSLNDEATPQEPISYQPPQPGEWDQRSVFGTALENQAVAQRAQAADVPPTPEEAYPEYFRQQRAESDRRQAAFNALSETADRLPQRLKAAAYSLGDQVQSGTLTPEGMVARLRRLTAQAAQPAARTAAPPQRRASATVSAPPLQSAPGYFDFRGGGPDVLADVMNQAQQAARRQQLVRAIADPVPLSPDALRRARVRAQNQGPVQPGSPFDFRSPDSQLPERLRPQPGQLEPAYDEARRKAMEIERARAEFYVNRRLGPEAKDVRLREQLIQAAMTEERLDRTTEALLRDRLDPAGSQAARQAAVKASQDELARRRALVPTRSFARDLMTRLIEGSNPLIPSEVARAAGGEIVGMGNLAAQGALNSAADIPGGLAILADDSLETDAVRRAVLPSVQRFKQWTERTFPDRPEAEGFFRTVLPKGLGSTVPFLVGGAAGAAARIPSWASSLAMGAAMNAAQDYDDALQHNATPEQAMVAARMGSLIGMTEAMGLGRVIDKFGGKRAIVRQVLDSAEEGGQEWVQNWLDDVNAKLIAGYDPQRSASPFTEQTLEAALAGLVSGGMFQAAGSATSRLFPARPQSVPAVTGPEATNNSPQSVNEPAIPSQPEQSDEVRKQGILSRAINKLRNAGVEREEDAAAEQTTTPPDVPQTAVESASAQTAVESGTVPTAAERPGWMQRLANSIRNREAEAQQQPDSVADVLGKLEQRLEARQTAAVTDRIAEADQMMTLAAQQPDATIRERLSAEADQQYRSVLAELKKLPAYKAELAAVANGQMTVDQTTVYRQAAAVEAQLQLSAQQAQAQRDEEAQSHLNVLRSAASEARQAADAAQQQGDLSEAIVQYQTHQKALRDLAARLPKTSEGMQERNQIRSEIGRIGNLTGDLRRQLRQERQAAEQKARSEAQPDFADLAEGMRAPSDEGIDLVDLARRLGGLRNDDALSGEIRRLSPREGDFHGLINNKSGVTLNEFREAAQEAGLIDSDLSDSEVLELLESNMNARRQRQPQAQTEDDLLAEILAAQSGPRKGPQPFVPQVIEPVVSQPQAAEPVESQPEQVSEPQAAAVTPVDQYQQMLEANAELIDELSRMDVDSAEAGPYIEALDEYLAERDFDAAHRNTLLNVLRQEQQKGTDELSQNENAGLSQGPRAVDAGETAAEEAQPDFQREIAVYETIRAFSNRNFTEYSDDRLLSTGQDIYVLTQMLDQFRRWQQQEISALMNALNGEAKRRGMDRSLFRTQEKIEFEPLPAWLEQLDPMTVSGYDLIEILPRLAKVVGDAINNPRANPRLYTLAGTKEKIAKERYKELRKASQATDRPLPSLDEVYGQVRPARKKGGKRQAVADMRAALEAQQQAVAEQATPEAPEPESDKRRLAARFRDLWLTGSEPVSRADVRRMAAEELGRPIENSDPIIKTVDEAVELGAVLAVRQRIEQMRSSGASEQQIFAAVQELSERLPNLNARTSTSVAQQAYSTPLPLAYVASRLAGITDQTSVYEPTAGNGALLIEVNPAHAIVNELNPARAESLREQGFTTTEQDAATYEPADKVDVVIANPPFGTVRNEQNDNETWELTPTYSTTQIDHAIVMRSLEAMKDDGRAVLIVGSVMNEQDQEQRSDQYNAKAKRLFYYTLYNAYNVTDHFTVSGNLYKKQGAGWPVDVIVIKGRGKSQLRLPAADVPPVVTSYDELGRIIEANAVLESGRDADTLSGETERPATAESGNLLEPAGRADSESARPGRESDAGGAGTRGGTGSVQPDIRTGGSRADDSGQSETEGAPVSVGSDAVYDQSASSGSGISETGVGTGEPERLAQRTDEGAGRPPSVEEIFDEAFDELFGAQPEASATEPKVTPQPAARPQRATRNPRKAAIRQQPKTTVEAVKSAGQEVSQGLDQIAEGLGKLFGDPSMMRSGFAFDDQQYEAAKPYFQQAMNHFANAARDVREAMRLLLKALNTQYHFSPDTLRRMKLYIVRFIEEQTTPQPLPEQTPVQQIEASASHLPYHPASEVTSLNVAVPRNMGAATQQALSRFREKYGSTDVYTVNKLGYLLSELGQYFSAEQVDAIALAVSNLEAKKGFIIGDQAGIGKGRVNAAVIRYAIKQGKVPIFVTQKPALYADMMRDLTDIGSGQVRVLITNGNETVPLNDAATEWLLEAEAARAAKSTVPPQPRDAKLFRAGSGHEAKLNAMANSGKLNDYDVIFTTYDQMNPQNGKFEAARHALIQRFAADNMLILDESHSAGGTEVKKPREGTVEKAGRAAFFRRLVNAAGGVFYSSATYAKRPDVMDLYSKTDLGTLGRTSAQLAEIFQSGGIALQQIVAAKLAATGQYLRRERTFDGIRYDAPLVHVDRGQAEAVSRAMSLIADFDVAKGPGIKRLVAALKAEGQIISRDSAVGNAAAESTNFTSLMHNVVEQMLVGLKADEAARLAIEAVRQGHKPVITVANTMESFLNDAGLEIGDPVDLTFKDVLLRYLQRSRDVTIRDADGSITRRPLEDDELTPAAREAYRRAYDFILESPLDNLPVSPIDYLRQQLAAAGLRVDEITGRGTRVDYSGEVPVLRSRPNIDKKVVGRRRVINQFNNGDLDVVILNQAGSTGISLHASEKVRDQRPRVMIVWQAERNVDTHMQMLYRINRTGQVVLPSYMQMIADVPAEKRPAAVLLKKIASLNANTTASRQSALAVEGVTDFLNTLGDEIVAEVMQIMPDIHAALKSPLSEDGETLQSKDAARRVTGRIPLLPLAEQERIYRIIEQEYRDHLAQKEALGENPLEARTLDLQAVPISRRLLTSGDAESPFTEPSWLELMRVQVPVKPYTSAEITALLQQRYGAPENYTLAQVRQEYGTAEIRRLREQMQEQFAGWRDKLSDAAEETRSLQGRLTAAEAMVHKWYQIINEVTPGVGIETRRPNGEVVNGIVLGIEKRGAPQNPAALSAWRVRMAVLDGRELTLKFTDLLDKETKSPRVRQVTEVSRYNPENGLFEYRPLLPEFDQSATRTQLRWMITGNVVAGYGQMKRGSLLNFTDQDGLIHQGVLMSTAFDPDRAMAEAPVSLRPEHVLTYLSKVSSAVAGDEDQVLKISRNVSGEIVFRVPGSKKLGGKYFLSPAFRALGVEFSGNRSEMRAVVNRSTAELMIEALDSGKATGEPVPLIALTGKDEARKLLSQQPALMAGPADAEQLQDERDDLQIELEDLDFDLAEIGGDRPDTAQHKTVIADLDERIRNVRNELKGVEKELNAARSVIAKTEPRLKRTQAALTEANEASSRLESELRARAEAESGPDNDVQTRFEELIDGSPAWERTLDRIDRLTAQAEELDQQVGEAQDTVERKGSERQDLLEEIAGLEGERRETRAEAEDLRERHAELMARRRELTARAKELDERIAEAERLAAQRPALQSGPERDEFGVEPLRPIRSDIANDRWTPEEFYSGLRAIYEQREGTRRAVIYVNQRAQLMLAELMSRNFPHNRNWYGANLAVSIVDRIIADLRDTLNARQVHPAAEMPLRDLLGELEAARAEAQQEIAVIRVDAPSSWRDIYEHEIVIHGGQRILGQGAVESALDDGWVRELPEYDEIAKILSRHGYRAADLTFEIPAWIAGNDYKTLGLTRARAAEILTSYFRAIVERHGRQALEAFAEATGITREAIERYNHGFNGRNDAADFGDGSAAAGGRRALPADEGSGEGVFAGGEGRPRSTAGNRAVFAAGRRNEQGQITFDFSSPTSPLRDALTDPPLRVDAAAIEQRALAQLIEAGQRGSLPGERARRVWQLLGVKGQASRVARTQRAFIGRVLEQIDTLLDGSEKLEHLERGTPDYERARRTVRGALLRINNELSKTAEYSRTLPYGLQLTKASILAAWHILEKNCLAQLADAPIHELSKLVPPVPQWVLKRNPELDLRVPAFSLGANIAGVRAVLGELLKGAVGFVNGQARESSQLWQTARFGASELIAMQDIARELYQQQLSAQGIDPELVGAMQGGAEKYEMHHRPRLAPGLDRLALSSFRASAVADVPGRLWAYTVALTDQAFRRADEILKQQGVTGKGRTRQLYALARDLAHEPTADMKVVADYESNQYVLDVENIFHRAVESLNQTLSSGDTWARRQLADKRGVWATIGRTAGTLGFDLARVVLNSSVLFSKIPGTSLVTSLVRYSPLGTAWSAIRTLKLLSLEKNQISYDPLMKLDVTRDFQKSVIGSAAMLLTGLLWQAGLIGLSGGADDDEKKRNLQEVLGQGYEPEVYFGPYTVKIGGSELKIPRTAARVSWFGSLGRQGALIGRLAQALPSRTDPATGEPEEEKTRARRTGMALWRGIGEDIPLMRGLHDTFDSITSGRALTGGGLARTMASRLVPGFVAEEAQRRFPYAVQTDKEAGATLASRIPGLREKLPPRLDAFGRPVRQPSQFNPLRTVEAQPDLEELQQLGVGIPKPERKAGESIRSYNNRVTGEGLSTQAAIARLSGDQMLRAFDPAIRRQVLARQLTGSQIERAEKLTEDSRTTETQIEATRAIAYQMLRESETYRQLPAWLRNEVRQEINQFLEPYRARAGSGKRREKPARLPDVMDVLNTVDGALKHAEMLRDLSRATTNEER